MVRGTDEEKRKKEDVQSLCEIATGSSRLEQKVLMAVMVVQTSPKSSPEIQITYKLEKDVTTDDGVVWWCAGLRFSQRARLSIPCKQSYNVN